MYAAREPPFQILLAIGIVGYSGVAPHGEYWRERVAAHERSGLSVKQFCEQQQITEQSFYVWRKRLRNQPPMRFALVEAGVGHPRVLVESGQKPNEAAKHKRSGRYRLARHLKGERIVHDLAESEKHCQGRGKDLRLIAEETSERYDYIPASMRVIQDVRLKYACDCTIKTAAKPPQPIEKARPAPAYWRK